LQELAVGVVRVESKMARSLGEVRWCLIYHEVRAYAELPPTRTTMGARCAKTRLLMRLLEKSFLLAFVPELV
jgi:hypothetical protein